MKTFKRYLSSINKGSIVELLAKFYFFIDIGKRRDGDDYEPDTLLGL